MSEVKKLRAELDDLKNELDQLKALLGIVNYRQLPDLICRSLTAKSESQEYAYVGPNQNHQGTITVIAAEDGSGEGTHILKLDPSVGPLTIALYGGASHLEPIVSIGHSVNNGRVILRSKESRAGIDVIAHSNTGRITLYGEDGGKTAELP